MITDVYNTFADAVESLGDDGQVGDIIDLTNSVAVNPDIGEGNPVMVHLVINIAYLTATSEEFSVRSCATVGGTYVEAVSFGVKAIAALSLGAEFKVALPAGCDKFLQLYRAELGTDATAGTISAWIAPR